MITTDGQRSLKRKWFAEKQIKIIRDIDVPSKTLILDGFTISVWQQDSLDGGRITAPMGVVVGVSTQDGIKLATADFYAGAFSALSDMHTIHFDTATGSKVLKTFYKVPEEDMILDGNQIVPFRPMPMLSPFGTDQGTTTEDTEWLLDRPCDIGLFPYKNAEAYWLETTDNMWLDLNENGTADFPKYIVDRSRTPYPSNGSILGNRYGYSLQTPGPAAMPWRFLHRLGETTYTSYHSTHPEQINNRVIVSWDFEGLETSKTYVDDLIPEGSIPDGLRSILVGPEIFSGPIGIFKFMLNGELSTFYAIDATNQGAYPAGSSYRPLYDYFQDHPEDEKYKLLYCLKVGSTSYIIDSSQFILLLDTLSTDTIFDVSGTYTIWSRALNMMTQLTFVPPANHSFNVPHDTRMFFTHDGDIHVWTRKYGGVKFTTTGLFAETLNYPPEILEIGVHPEVIYCGTYEDEPFYFCACVKQDKVVNPDGSEEIPVEIKGLYTGSPFGTWTSLGLPEEGTLVYIRPVKITPESTQLLGVVKITTEDGAHYKLILYLNEWKLLGKIPIPVGTSDNISVTLFGNGGMVRSLLQWQEVIQPQMPIGPYDLYATGQP